METFFGIMLILIFLTLIFFVYLFYHIFEPVRKYFTYKWNLIYKEEYEMILKDYNEWKISNYDKFLNKSTNDIFSSYKLYFKSKLDNVSWEIFDRIEKDIIKTKADLKNKEELED